MTSNLELVKLGLQCGISGEVEAAFSLLGEFGEAHRCERKNAPP